MPPLALVFGLLALPSVGLLARLARGAEHSAWLVVLALAVLTLSSALRSVVVLRPRSVARALGFVPLVLLWAWFYAVDLHRAQFAWVLLVVPLGAGLGLSTWRWENVALGAIVGLSAVWALMLPRSDNGCTGVSGAYGMVLLLHPIMGVVPAPWLIAANVRGRNDL